MVWMLSWRVSTWEMPVTFVLSRFSRGTTGLVAIVARKGKGKGYTFGGVACFVVAGKVAEVEVFEIGNPGFVEGVVLGFCPLHFFACFRCSDLGKIR